MISTTGRHALKALTTLAQLPPGRYAGTADVAKEIGAPRNYLGKLLQALAADGLVTSQKGLGGGFRLARDPAKITLYEVMDHVEHVSRWSGCFLRTGTCSSRTPCAVHARWKETRDSYLSFLQNTTIADLTHA